MGLYTCKAYIGTGFSPLNIPDSVATLQNATSKTLTFDSVYLLQDLALQDVKVKGTWDQCEAIDYVQVDNVFYFCTGVRMSNENTAILTLELDALTTIGINNLIINSGWCTRRHVNDDTMFSNVIEEDWGPTEPPVQEVSNIGVSSENPATILASQVSLETDDMQFYCDTYQNPDLTDSTISVPRVMPIPKPSSLSMQVGDTTFTKDVPATGLYVLKYAGGDYSESLNNKVQIVRSLGLDQSIVGCYNVPGDFLTILERPGDKSQYDLLGSSYIIKDTKLSFTWGASGYTVRNNKVFAGQYSKFAVVSPASGDRTDFDAHDIKNDGSTFQVGLFADIGPQGKPYCRPVSYLNLDADGLNGFIGATQGAEWQNAPLAFQLASGATVSIRQGEQRWGIEQRNLGVQEQQLLDGWVSMAGGVLGSMLNVGTSTSLTSAIGNGLSAIPNAFVQGRNRAYAEVAYENNEMNLMYDKFNTYASTMFISPEIKFPRTNSLQDYVGNGFYVVHTHLSPKDTEKFDRYLTMFGYKVNEILSIGCFSGRQYFNFVQAQSVDITVNANIPLRVKMKAIEQLSQGVRVWHTKPSNVYFNNNPIV